MMVVVQIFLAVFNSHQVILYIVVPWFLNDRPLQKFFLLATSSGKYFYNEQFMGRWLFSSNFFSDTILCTNDKEPANHLLLHCDCFSKVQSQFLALFGVPWASNFVSYWDSESFKKKQKRKKLATTL